MMNQNDKIIAGLYDLEETLGKGHYAVVKVAKHVFTGEKVAVKVILKTKLDDIAKKHLSQEVSYMKLVQHPNIVRLYEVIDTETKLYLILELGDGGDMYDYISRHENGLPESLAKKYFYQILQGITYCHKLHIVHRDLKPENIVFFEQSSIVKLTDFGFSKQFLPGQKLETLCGSLAYSAPEILLGDSYDAPAVDVWSLGVLLYMLVCGKSPFQEVSHSETLTRILDCRYKISSKVSKSCRKLIRRMLVKNPLERATLTEIAGHEWLQSEINIPENKQIEPLISHTNLPKEDQEIILSNMILGDMGQKEEILQALEQDAYNHLTATFYLLAEKRLRNICKQNVVKQNSLEQNCSKTSLSSHASLSSLLMQPHHFVCNNMANDFQFNTVSQPVPVPKLSDLSVCSTPLSASLSSSSSSPTSPNNSYLSVSNFMSRSHQFYPIVHKLNAIKSSPQIYLKEIEEENETNDIDDSLSCSETPKIVNCSESFSMIHDFEECKYYENVDDGNKSECSNDDCYVEKKSVAQSQRLKNILVEQKESKENFTNQTLESTDFSECVNNVVPNHSFFSKLHPFHKDVSSNYPIFCDKNAIAIPNGSTDQLERHVTNLFIEDKMKESSEVNSNNVIQHPVKSNVHSSHKQSHKLSANNIKRFCSAVHCYCESHLVSLLSRRRPTMDVT